MKLTRLARTVAVLGSVASVLFASVACHDSDEPKDGSGGGSGHSHTYGMKLVAQHGSQPRPPELHLVRGFNSGPIIVDGGGHTVYRFERDRAQLSTCVGRCAETWRPVPFVVDMPIANLDPALVGSLTRADGITQATVSGRPLYTFTGDAMPGELTGQGKDNAWFVVGATGDKADITTVLEDSSAVNP